LVDFIYAGLLGQLAGWLNCYGRWSYQQS